MREEYIKEKVKFYTEILKVLSAFLIASAGGTLGLLFKKGEELAFWIAVDWNMGFLNTSFDDRSFGRKNRTFIEGVKR